MNLPAPPALRARREDLLAWVTEQLRRDHRVRGLWITGSTARGTDAESLPAYGGQLAGRVRDRRTTTPGADLRRLGLAG
jgi:hypothetical protein